MTEETRVSKDGLVEFCVRVFEKLGVPPPDARVSTDVLVLADLRNKGSHGVARLPRYVDGLRKGLMKPTNSARVVHKTETSALIDGGKSLGQVVGHMGMQLAIEMAKAHDMGFVTVRNSNHYGIAGYYSLMAAEEGCVGLSMTNAAPLVVPTFGRDAIFGTNPISISAPAEGDPFLLDMATSVVPRGKLEVHDREGKPLPPGWAVDSRGKGTTSPKEVLQNLATRAGGGILPLGGEGELYSGHKGYGLAMAVEVLCALLSGSPSALGTYVDESNANISHFFGAISVESFRPLREFKRDMQSLMDSVRGSPKADGCDHIYVHGEKGFSAQRDRLKHGIPLGPKVVESLKKIGGEFGVSWVA